MSNTKEGARRLGAAAATGLRTADLYCPSRITEPDGTVLRCWFVRGHDMLEGWQHAVFDKEPQFRIRRSWLDDDPDVVEPGGMPVEAYPQLCRACDGYRWQPQEDCADPWHEPGVPDDLDALKARADALRQKLASKAEG